jgi:hypothetical protein
LDFLKFYSPIQTFKMIKGYDRILAPEEWLSGLRQRS